MKSVLAKFEAYLLTEKRVSKNTFAAYQSDLGQFVQFLQNNTIELANVTGDHLKLFLHFLKGQEIGARSMARKISTLKLFFRWANERLSWNVQANQLRAPKLEKKLPTYLKPSEIEQLLQAAHADNSLHGKRNSVMLYLLYATGMRISELINLELAHLQLESALIYVLGKGGKGRLVPIPEHITSMIRNYIDTVRPQLMAAEMINGTPFLFPVLYGKVAKPISRQSFWMILNELCERAGIKKSISPHMLRHSLATHLLQQGANLRSLQMLLGHENLATVEIYTHLEKSHVRKVYDKKHPRA
ncbi:tyrosine recombinase [Candidatus Dependentiae bacterium]|nr:tyrosine recombinase [Candidatus Dependentiae bacterium]